MAIYTMHIKGAPQAAQKGAISITQADSLSQAISYFAQRKQLSTTEFNKLFTVKLQK
jgi:hypothetical protein